MTVTPKQKRITGLAITAILLLIAAYDAVAMFGFGTDATISRVVLGNSSVTPTIPFGIGFLMGHLFWPQPKPPA
jgi:hypothetical protein